MPRDFTFDPARIPADDRRDVAYDEAGDLDMTMHYALRWHYGDIGFGEPPVYASADLRGCTIGDASFDRTTTIAILGGDTRRVTRMEDLVAEEAQATLAYA